MELLLILIPNSRIAFRNNTSDIEYIQLDNLNSGGLKCKGDLTTEEGSVYVNEGNIYAENGVIKCKKIFVEYNGIPTDIIEVFSTLLGIKRTD